MGTHKNNLQSDIFLGGGGAWNIYLSDDCSLILIYFGVDSSIQVIYKYYINNDFSRGQQEKDTEGPGNSWKQAKSRVIVNCFQARLNPEIKSRRQTNPSSKNKNFWIQFSGYKRLSYFEPLDETPFCIICQIIHSKNFFLGYSIYL